MPATSWRSSPPPRSTRSTSSRSAFGCGSAARIVPTLSSIERNCSMVIILDPPLSFALPSLERGHRLERLRLEAGAHAGQVRVGELAHPVVELRLLDGGERLALLALPAFARAVAGRRRGARAEERRRHEEGGRADHPEAEQVDGERPGSRSMSSSS